MTSDPTPTGPTGVVPNTRPIVRRTQITDGWRVEIIGPLGLRFEGAEADLSGVVATHPAVVELDLSGVDVATSLGLGMLLQFRGAIIRRGGRVVVTAASPQIVDVLRKTRLDAVFGLPA